MDELASPFRPNSELLWQFDRELAAGREPAWDTILQQAPDDDRRRELCADMIRCESCLLGWDAQRLRARLRFYAQYDPSDFGAVHVIRGIYTDRLEAGEHPTRSEFESLGHSFALLELKTEEEPVYLGQVVAERFQIEQRLGLGSFGIVYRATDIIEHTSVAVKTIRLDGEDRETAARSMLEQEADMLSKLRTTGIPQLIAFKHESDDAPLLVREFVEGRTLNEVKSSGALEPKRAAQILARIADAVQFLHRHGLIFRDLSSSNVLLDYDDNPLLLDFGLVVSQDEPFDAKGTVAGTPGYMSYDAANGDTDQLDSRSDIWSLGVILYELLTGYSVQQFRGRHRAYTSSLAFAWELSHSKTSVPPELRSICENCTQGHLNDCYDTAGMLARDLRIFLGEQVPPLGAQYARAKVRLFAWRMGRKFGSAWYHHHFARWCWEEKQVPIGQAVLNPELRVRVISASETHMLNDLRECIELGNKIGTHLSVTVRELEWQDGFQLPDGSVSETDVQIAQFLDKVDHELSSGRAQLESHFRAIGQEAVALFDLSLLVGCRDPVSSNSMRDLARLAVIPESCCDRYIACVSDQSASADVVEEGFRVYKRVEQELMNRLADEMENKSPMEDSNLVESR